jgi:hypothetical protein
MACKPTFFVLRRWNIRLGNSRQSLKRWALQAVTILNALEQHRLAIQQQIANCTNAIADGQPSKFLVAKLSDLERELDAATEKIHSLRPDNLALNLCDARKFVERRLTDLRRLLNSDARGARAAISKHVQKITLTPAGRSYIVSGERDLLGENSGAAMMVPGARIELATPAFSGRRSTGELPRHSVHLV